MFITGLVRNKAYSFKNYKNMKYKLTNCGQQLI